MGKEGLVPNDCVSSWCGSGRTYRGGEPQCLGDDLCPVIMCNGLLNTCFLRRMKGGSVMTILGKEKKRKEKYSIFTWLS